MDQEVPEAEVMAPGALMKEEYNRIGQRFDQSDSASQRNFAGEGVRDSEADNEVQTEKTERFFQVAFVGWVLVHDLAPKHRCE